MNYLRMPRATREDTIYEVLGTALDTKSGSKPKAVIWTRTVSGYGHVQNGRTRTWSRYELENTDIVAIPEEEAL